MTEERKKLALEQKDEVEVIIIKPHPDQFEIERKRKTFHVHGETVERLTVMTDMELEEAVRRLQQRLRTMGLFTALQRAGAHDGSKVTIGDSEFTWDESLEPQVKP